MKHYTISHNSPTLFSSAKVSQQGSTVLVQLVDSQKSRIPFFEEQRKPHIIVPSFEGFIKPTPFQRESRTYRSFTCTPVSSRINCEDSIQLIVNTKQQDSKFNRKLNSRRHTEKISSLASKHKEFDNLHRIPPKSRFLAERKISPNIL